MLTTCIRSILPNKRSKNFYKRPNRRQKILRRVKIVAKPVSYTHLRAHETDSYLVCRLLLEKKNCCIGTHTDVLLLTWIFWRLIGQLMITLFMCYCYNLLL